MSVEQLKSVYNRVISSLKRKDNSGAQRGLKCLNANTDLNFDDEIEAVTSGRANYQMVALSVEQKFHSYLRNHVNFDTKRALKIIHRDLDRNDYTKDYNKYHLYRAYFESYFYLAPCGDVNSLRHDLLNGNYYDLKGDLAVISSNREDLISTSHTGNIRKFMSGIDN